LWYNLELTNMTKTKQLQKNLKLSQKLASYILSNPVVTKGLPGNASYVFFSSTDKKLNSANNEITKSLLIQGTAVIRAEETSNQKNPWKLTPLTL